jgi:DNA invertase Pin-like site-specific DNA recombinase
MIPFLTGWAAVNRVAIYSRVSTEDQAKEGFSLDAQKDRLRAYCQAKGWEIAGEYVDEGHSGRDTKRPAYQRMFEEKDNWDTVLVIKMDRIHRNSKNFMEMMDDLKKWGKEFSSMQESLDTSTAMGRFVMDIIQRIAQLESEQIGERVYMGMKQKASTVGGPLGGYAPFGYTSSEDGLQISEEEALHVRRIFNDYVGGKTMDRIAKELNSENVTTQKGGKWTLWSVRHILHNPVYCGFLKWDKIIRDGNHDPLVDIETYRRVQELSLKKTRRPVKHIQNVIGEGDANKASGLL